MYCNKKSKNNFNAQQLKQGLGTSKKLQEINFQLTGT